MEARPDLLSVRRPAPLPEIHPANAAVLRAFNGLVQLERAAPEVLVAEGIIAENVFALLGELFRIVLFLFRIKSKSANKRNGNHEGESDLFHGFGPLLSGV